MNKRFVFLDTPCRSYVTQPGSSLVETTIDITDRRNVMGANLTIKASSIEDAEEIRTVVLDALRSWGLTQ